MNKDEDFMKDYREKARKYIEKEQLVSVMNDTKWTEFRNAMINEMPFSPPYIIKNIYEAEEGLYFTHFNQDVNYLGAYDHESFQYLQYYMIEWVKVRPRYYEEVGGRLVSKKIIHDAEKEFIDILKKYNIPYEYENGVYTIFGYKRTKNI